MCFLRRFAVVCALLHFALLQSQLLRGTEFVVSTLTNDDTYYYLQTAWNFAQSGRATFDGIHETNGVQFLWFLMLVPLALIATTKGAFLYLVLTCTFALNSVTFLVVERVARRFHRGGVSFLLIALWFASSLNWTYASGLENSLHALVFWAALLRLLQVLECAEAGRSPRFVALALLLVLNAWTRMDSAVFSAVLFGAAVLFSGILHPRHRAAVFSSAPSILTAGALATVGLVVMLAGFWLIGGSALPVSAMVKTSEVWPRLPGTLWDRLPGLAALSLPPLLPSVALQTGSRLIGWAALAFLSVVAIVLSSGSLLRKHVPHAVYCTWLTLLAAVVLYHAAILATHAYYVPYFVWYRSPLYVFWTVTGGVVILALTSKADRWHREWQAAVVVLSILLVTVTALRLGRAARVEAGQENFHTVRYRVATGLGDTIPRDSVCAAWNTGELAFFSGFTFINLDGLVNSPDFFRQVLCANDPADSLHKYLREQSVDYVVDYHSHGMSSNWVEFAVYPCTSERDLALRIWKIPRGGP